MVAEAAAKPQFDTALGNTESAFDTIAEIQSYKAGIDKSHPGAQCWAKIYMCPIVALFNG